MKNKNDRSKLRLPQDAMEQCRFDPDTPLCLHTAEDALVVLPGEMTALQVVRALDALGAMASELIHSLKDACGACESCPDGCPYVDMDGPEAELCEGLRYAAGIPRDAKLEAVPHEGAVTITAANYSHDLTDVPADIRDLLAVAGVCLGELDELLMAGGVVRHG